MNKKEIEKAVNKVYEAHGESVFLWIDKDRLIKELCIVLKDKEKTECKTKK